MTTAVATAFRSARTRVPDMTLWILAGFMACGLVAAWMFAAAADGSAVRWGVLTGTIAMCSAAVGGLTGFLFGIPRAIQKGQPQPLSDDDYDYGDNTNLEQVSDWLTKILVGVGLTQIGTLPSHLRALGGYLAGGFQQGNNSNEVFIVLAVTFFLIIGFIFGYHWSRTTLRDILRQQREERQRLAELASHANPQPARAP